MTAKNDITGDNIVSKTSKDYTAGYKLIKPLCFEDCNYLIDTLSKCKLCDWRPEKLEKK